MDRKKASQFYAQLVHFIQVSIYAVCSLADVVYTDMMSLTTSVIFNKVDRALPAPLYFWCIPGKSLVPRL